MYRAKTKTRREKKKKGRLKIVHKRTVPLIKSIKSTIPTAQKLNRTEISGKKSQSISQKVV